MKKTILFLCLFLSLVFVSRLFSAEDTETPDPSLLTLERIFSSEEFTAQTFGPARWLNHKNGYTTLEPANTKKGGQDIVRYQPKTGQRHIEVPAAHLIPEGKSSPLKIEDYQWSGDGTWLLIFTDSQRGVAAKHPRRLLGV